MALLFRSIESQKNFLLTNNSDLCLSCAGLLLLSQQILLKVAEEIVSENLPDL